MAEQEMEYRVDLFNRLSFTSTSYTYTGLSPLHLALAVAEGCSCICAGWCQAVLRSAWTKGEPSDLCKQIDHRVSAVLQPSVQAAPLQV